jgi:hypothetical protein
MQELKLPQKLSRDFYGIGHHRLSRLINQNTRQSAKGGNGRLIKDDTIVTLDASLDENIKDAEVGFPCLHRRRKLYLPHEITSYRMLWFRYSDWVCQQKVADAFSAEKTFMKYLRSYRSDVVIRGLVEDLCDTCVRIKVALGDDLVLEEDKQLLRQGNMYVFFFFFPARGNVIH